MAFSWPVKNEHTKCWNQLVPVAYYDSCKGKCDEFKLNSVLEKVVCGLLVFVVVVCTVKEAL